MITSQSYQLILNTNLIHKADGLIVRTQRVSADMIKRAIDLKIVSRYGVGYDAVDISALNIRGIPLAIIGDVNSRPVAEHTMMLILALAKKSSITIWQRVTENGTAVIALTLLNSMTRHY